MTTLIAQNEILIRKEIEEMLLSDKFYDMVQEGLTSDKDDLLKYRYYLLNEYVLETFGHLLSNRAKEIALTLIDDDWDQGGYELLLAAERL